MEPLEQLQSVPGLGTLEAFRPSWEDFKKLYDLSYQGKNAAEEENDRTWFAWQSFRGEHRPQSCLLDAQGQVIGLILVETDLEELSLPALPALQYLCVCGNKNLRSVQFEGEYPQLVHVDLSGNALESLDLRISLPKLTNLNICKNKIAELNLNPSLPGLQELDASQNQLKRLVLPGELSALRYLYLEGNGMEALETNSDFSELRTLHLKDNQLRELPRGNYDKLEVLYVQGNPLEAYEEALVKGNDSGNALEIISQLRNIAISGELPNYRAKLVIVGNGRVGKTCLIKRLKGEAFNAQETYTHGVVISEMEKSDFPGVKTDKLYLKIWDFGGQEVFYATHQFFMSEEALYVYAWTDQAIADQNRDKDVLKSPKHRWRNHAYWLENVRMHSEKSPLLIVKTHHLHPDAQESFPDPLKEKYQEGPYLNFDANSQETVFVDRVKQAITEALGKLPILGAPFPKNYYDLMADIATYRRNKIQEIPRTTFDELATKHRIQEKDRDAALGYLHKTGEVVYFDKEGLKDVVYIDPVALTKRLYKLIEGNEYLEKNSGEFDEAYAEKVFDSLDWHTLLRLLENFGLVFRKPGNRTLYIAPQYLPDLSDPIKVNDRERKAFESHRTSLDWRFSLRYPLFLPENVMVNLLCVFGPYATDLVYRNAIYFQMTHKSKGCVIRMEEEQPVIEVYTDSDPEGDTLAKEVFEKFKALSKKAEIHVSVEQDKWVKGKLLEDKSQESYPTADGEKNVDALKFRFLQQSTFINENDRGINFDNYPKGPQIIEVQMAPDAVAKVAFEEIEKPLKLLFTAATPDEQRQINTGLESSFKRLIEQYGSGSIKVEQEHGLKFQDFILEVGRHRPHILHFGGHGEAKALILEDKPIGVDTLLALTRNQPALQLVVLNACNTLPIAKEIAKYVPYVVGTQGPLEDSAAITFANIFYGLLASGNSIEAAFDIGVSTVASENKSMGTVPVLVSGKRAT